MSSTHADGVDGTAAVVAIPSAADGDSVAVAVPVAAASAAEAAQLTTAEHGDPIALHVETVSESSDDSGWELLQETGHMLGHFMLAVLQGLVGLVPLLLMWSCLCTLVALLLLPCDVALAVVHVAKQARAQGVVKTVCGLLLIVVVAAMWPVVVCTFHLMAAFVLAFSEPFEHQPSDEWFSLTLGGLCSMFSFATDRMADFLRLCWVSRVDFWLKWKMMVRAVTSFLVFFVHVAVTGACSALLATVKLPVIAVIGATLPWFLCASLSSCFAGNNKFLHAALWLITVPVIAPVVLAISVLSCGLFVVAYAIGSSFLVVMSILGGGLYVADCQFKKMSWRTTRLAIAFVITEFDKDTSELLSHVIMEEAEIGRLLPALQDPYPEFTTDESGAGLNSQANALDESCEAFLECCREQSQVLMANGWLQAADFLNAEPFLFMGVPGHTLLTYMQQSPYETIILKPGYEVKLQEDVLGTSWVDPLRQELLNLQVQVFETCIKGEEWRYLKAWVLLSGDEERMPALGVQNPSNAERAAQLHRVAGAVNSMAISITRMAWFQAHFQKRVMDVAMEISSGTAPADMESRTQHKLCRKPSIAKLDMAEVVSGCSANGIAANYSSESCSPRTADAVVPDLSLAPLEGAAISAEVAHHSVALNLPALTTVCSRSNESAPAGKPLGPSSVRKDQLVEHVTIEMTGPLSQPRCPE